MSVNYFFESLHLLKPEIAVSISLAIVLIFDLIFPSKKKILPALAVLGLVATTYFIIEGYTLHTAFRTTSGRSFVAADSFASFFKLIVTLATLFIIAFSVLSKELKSCEDRLGEYYTLIFGMVLGMFFMINSNDLLLIYLSVELVSLSSYVLAGFMKTSRQSTEASLKYIIYGGVASGIMLFGISLLYGLTGSTNIIEINQILHIGSSSYILTLLSIIFIITGIGYKISGVPFHFWTPDVYQGAPTTITAYLSVASKAAGFALLLRFIFTGFTIAGETNIHWLILPVFEWKEALIIFSILTMTVGNFAALWQDDLKRMLAYSSIAHAGYMLAAVAALSDQGMFAVMIYFAAYLFMNLGAFFVVILISNKIGSEDIDDYDGLGKVYPLYGVIFGLFLISLTGLPPTVGFIGKLYMFIALVDSSLYMLAFIAVLNSVVSLYYYVRVLKHMFFNQPRVEFIRSGNEFSEKLILFLLAIPVLIFGIYFTPLIDLVNNSLKLLQF